MISFIKKYATNPLCDFWRLTVIVLQVFCSTCLYFVTAADLIREGGAIIVETLSSILKAIYIVIHKGRIYEHAGSCRKEQKYLNILAIDTVVLIKLITARHGFSKQVQTFLL